MRERRFNKALTVRLTAEQMDQIRERAEYNELSMTDVVRDLIAEKLDEDKYVTI